MAMRLQERRVLEEMRQNEEKLHTHVDPTVYARVQKAAGAGHADMTERIEKKVEQRRHDNVVRQMKYNKELGQISQRVERRPLLMERSETTLRARQRALYKVREKLTGAGVHNANALFLDEEL